MHMLGWYFGAVCLIVAAVSVWISHQRSQKTIKRLDAMLEQAMVGANVECSFDESMLSALETRFAQYLSASNTSSQNLIKEKDRIKELIADISHQTKTPIANLLLYAELLQEENLSLEAATYADILHEQTKKLQFLVDALVKLSRLENGIILLHPQNHALSPVLQQVQKQFSQKAAEKGLLFKVSPTQATACFDPKWTAEALCNLVDNSIKYTQTGSVTLSIVPYELFVRVDISDTGVGIPENQQAQIFSRFYRGNNHSQQEGVGIGLYLAREILRNEGGYIKVFSQEGKGSIFSVFLPI